MHEYSNWRTHKKHRKCDSFLGQLALIPSKYAHFETHANLDFLLGKVFFFFARLVAMMGGHIWLESEPGKGSTFYFVACFEKGDSSNCENHLSKSSSRTRQNLPNLINPLIETRSSSSDQKVDDEKVSDDDIRTHPSLEGICSHDESVLEGKPGVNIVQRNNSPKLDDNVVTLEMGEEDSCQKTRVTDLTASNANISECKQSGGVNPGLILKGIKVLLAEDNLVNQKVACQQLKKFGTEVEVVNDGQQCLNALHKDREKYDLILMDVQVGISVFYSTRMFVLPLFPQKIYHLYSQD